MSDFKGHTPGPWKVESSTLDGARVVAIAPVAWCGANSSFGVDASQSISANQARANAHLIAAAPDLLEALDLMLQRYGYETCEYVQKALAALAKAKGKES